MKASEVLQRYANGERDFRGANIRGQNFRGKDLSRSDFSGADIRGTKFTKSTLRNVNFSRAKTGLPHHWILLWLFSTFVLAVLSGWLMAVLMGGVTNYFDAPTSLGQIIGGYIGICLIFVFGIIALMRGLGVTIRCALGAFIVLFLVGGAFPNTFQDTSVALGVGGVGAGIGAVTVAVVVIFRVAFTVAFIVRDTVGGIGIVAGAVISAVTFKGGSAGAVAVLIILLNSYIGWRTLKSDPKDAWVRSVAVAVAAIGGTSFRGADLTDANFSQVQIKSADLRRANLTRTNWKDATKLDQIRPGDTYLSNPKIQTLLTTGNGKDQDFDSLLNLVGLNLIDANLENASFLGSTLKDATLQGANLTGANLILANLNHANLQGADLTNAKLVQTQLDHADLTGATLTGAVIEEWGITSATILDGIRCDYVFMRLLPAGSRTDNPRRKPDDWDKTFAEGEFVEFITPLMETLDLYHNQTADPRAMALAFNDLRQQHPDAELDIVSMEKRGKNRDKFLIRAETNPDADLSELHSQYFERYNYLRTLTAEALQALLIEKENHVKMLAGLISTAITKPTTQIETYQNQGDTVMGNKESTNETNLEIGSMAGAINTGGGHATASEFTQNVTNIESKQTLAEAAAEIQTLLKQIETNYGADSVTDKMVMAAEAVKQIEANPTFKQKAVSALVAGGTKALEAAINHPAAAFVVGAIEEWKDR